MSAAHAGISARRGPIVKVGAAARAAGCLDDGGASLGSAPGMAARRRSSELRVFQAADLVELARKDFCSQVTVFKTAKQSANFAKEFAKISAK